MGSTGSVVWVKMQEHPLYHKIKPLVISGLVFFSCS